MSETKLTNTTDDPVFPQHKIHFVKEWRKFSGLTQGEVADAVNLTQSTVARWETGATNPSIDDLPNLAALFGCSVPDLFRDPTTPTEAIKALLKHPAQWEVVSRLDLLERRVRQIDGAMSTIRMAFESFKL